MYYRVYGVMSASGFHTEVGNGNTLEKALGIVKGMNEKQYPLFSITEHVNSGSPALTIRPGVTRDREVAVCHSLIVYQPNPMENFKLAEALFGLIYKKMEDSDADKNNNTGGDPTARSDSRDQTVDNPVRPTSGERDGKEEAKAERNAGGVSASGVPPQGEESNELLPASGDTSPRKM